MNFRDALKAMRTGKKVRLPEWRGYWFMDKKEKVFAMTKDGDVKDGWPSEYMNREDFELAYGCDFGWAITALKAGKLVTRKGWNGKGMFVFIRPSDELSPEMIVNKVKSLPKGVKDFVYNSGPLVPLLDRTDNIKFTAYLCMKNAQGEIMNGWAATQTDCLAEDWELFEQQKAT